MRTLCVLLLLFLSVIQFAAKAQQVNIQGTWYSNSSGDEMTLILNADGTGKFDDEAIKYTVKDNKFTITIVAEAETHTYTYTLKENSLTVSGGDLEEPITFTRKGSSSQ